MRYQIIAFTLGSLLTVLGVAQLLPMLLDYYDGHYNAQSFFLCAVISIFFGGALMTANKNFKQSVSVRQAFLLTSLSWLFVSLFAALPLYISDLDISFTDAFFEATAGITTTGATVLSGLDDMSRGALFWRSMMQWIGGIGVIAFGLILLPYLKIGGMQLFKSEAHGSEKPLARINILIVYLMYIYIGLTALAAVTYKILGMSWFDAINHAMTSISTGGFSTHDASFGFFADSTALQNAAIVFMILGAIPFILYIKLIFQDRNRFLKDEQIRGLAFLLVLLTLFMGVWLWVNSDYTIFQSLHLSLFNIVSIITTTGYASADYTGWGTFALMFFFFITYLGGCAGSTAGGLKIMRLIILARVLIKHLKTLLYPNGVFAAQYQGHALKDRDAVAILGFIGLYVIFNVGLTTALTFTGLDFVTAVSGAATALANVGPGAGNIIGPAGNFEPLNVAAKWLLCFGMIAGRLEILTIAVLFTPRYWDRA